MESARALSARKQNRKRSVLDGCRRRKLLHLLQDAECDFKNYQTAVTQSYNPFLFWVMAKNKYMV
jgi:hypothetical protein